MTKALSSMNRRQFLKQAALATSAIALPTFIPAAALGRDGKVAPSNRVVMAGIGIGGRGDSVMGSWFLSQKDVHFVAICDVRKNRRLAMKGKVDKHNGSKDCKMYIDMEEVIARPDVDAIVTATGDRLHATVSIRAMRAGKDVYSEKPATMTIAEGQELVRTAAAHGRVYQAGMQRLSEANFIFCDELARSGRLGEIKRVEAGLWNQGDVQMSRTWLPTEEEPSPEDLDWDRWLGPCPWRPYNKQYIGCYSKNGWAYHYDYSTSVIGGWGSHTFASCHAALDMQHTSPVHYPYVPNPNADGLTMTFANGITMTSQRKGWRGTCGVRYIGTEGWCAVADNYSAPDVSDPAFYSDFRKIVQSYLLRTGRETNHVRNFLSCVKSRKETVANPTMTHRSMSTVHCANIAQWLKRDLTWDPVKEEFVNDEQANRLRSRASREGWQIV
jgi:hypothetical protein